MVGRRYRIDPDTGLMVPLKPSEIRRARAAELSLPPPNAQGYDDLVQRLTADLDRDPIAKHDIERRFELALRKAHITEFLATGLPASDHVRNLWREFAFRALNHGSVSAMPTSFAVGEMFVRFDKRLMFWELLPEKEHLLQLDDYLDWYNSHPVEELASRFRSEASLEEGIIHHYNFVNDAAATVVDLGDSVVTIAGVSLVRRSGEIAALIVGGEYPPTEPSISEVIYTPPEKRHLEPGDFGADDRLLKGWLPTMGRVYMMSMVDIGGDRHGHRYFYRDVGNSYAVASDSPHLLNELPPEVLEQNSQALQGVSGLFAMLLSCLYLPLMIEDVRPQCAERDFATELHTERKEENVRKLLKKVPLHERPSEHASVLCVPSLVGTRHGLSSGVTPPSITFDNSGYWREINAGQIGTDKNGSPVVGKTWVEVTKAHHEAPAAEFLERLPRPLVGGSDPGIVYVVRSASHQNEVYKVGLTRRTAERRGKELSSTTATPLPFEILAQWEVGDCGAVEHEAHSMLSQYRVNPKREFFRCPLAHIVNVVGSIVENEQRP